MPRVFAVVSVECAGVGVVLVRGTRGAKSLIVLAHRRPCSALGAHANDRVVSVRARARPRIGPANVLRNSSASRGSAPWATVNPCGDVRTDRMDSRAPSGPAITTIAVSVVRSRNGCSGASVVLTMSTKASSRVKTFASSIRSAEAGAVVTLSTDATARTASGRDSFDRPRLAVGSKGPGTERPAALATARRNVSMREGTMPVGTLSDCPTNGVTNTMNV